MPSTLATVHMALPPEHLLHTEWFAVLAAFVALNTIMYCALAVSKVLPKLYVSDWVRSPNRRSQTRSIYPEGYVLEADKPDVERHAVLDPVA